MNFRKFAPWYTIACIIVFALFQLYNNMWRYAGLNDLNRIVWASLVTCVIQILGTIIFISKMPLSYYILGAFLQLVFIIIIRFSYRIIKTEHIRIKKQNMPAINAVIIGISDIARQLGMCLEESPVYRVVCYVDPSNNSSGQMLNGVPISGKEGFSNAISQYDIKTVFLTSATIPVEERSEIHRICHENGLELQDYTGFLSNLSGKISITGLMEVAKGPVCIVVGEKEKWYQDGEKVIRDLGHQYQVKAISAASEGLRIELQDIPEFTNNEKWMQEYKEKTGEDVSFF